MKVKFIEDIGRDVENWHRALNSNSYGENWRYIPKDVDESKVEDVSYLRGFLDDKYYKSGKISEFISWLEQNINPNQTQEDLESLMGRKFDDKVIEIYITIFGSGTYDFREYLFFLNYCHRDPEKSASRIYHELMHFLFHEYFWEECRASGLSEPQIHDLKESLTVLLNPILEKRGLPLDEGYPKHQELRAKLNAIWEEKSWKFEDFLKKVLELKLAE